MEFIYFLNVLQKVLINNVCSLETNANKINLGGMACSRIRDQQMQHINPKIGRVNGPARKSALLSQNCGLHRFNLPSLHNPAF